jgi:hypothetical protein
MCLCTRLIVETILVEKATPGLHQPAPDFAAEIVEKDEACLCTRLIVETILVEKATPGLRQPARDLTAIV